MLLRRRNTKIQRRAGCREKREEGTRVQKMCFSNGCLDAVGESSCATRLVAWIGRSLAQREGAGWLYSRNSTRETCCPRARAPEIILPVGAAGALNYTTTEASQATYPTKRVCTRIRRYLYMYLPDTEERERERGRVREGGEGRGRGGRGVCWRRENTEESTRGRRVFAFHP